MGTSAASDLTLAPGAGHGGEGDASLQGPAQEEELPASPKPTQAEVATDESGAVIALAARAPKPEADDLVTVRPKPEKRKNAKERAKDKRTKPEAAEEAAVTPEVNGLSTAHPKPQKRKNAKERAKEKYTRNSTEGGTTPMTAKAKSKVETK